MKLKKLLVTALAAAMLLATAACGESGAASKTSGQESAKPAQPAPTSTVTSWKGIPSSKILVAYFSRAGENYDVGYIKVGNTHLMANMIAQATGAKEFEITPVKPYPQAYKATTEIAKKELKEKARPAIQGPLPELKDYDVVFLGYPIWGGDMPMVVYTFMEQENFQGKTIIPFCTSGGEYMTGEEKNIPQYAKGARVLQGLGLEGAVVQKNPDQAKPKVEAWLKGLDLSK